jgi:hypothetical protein
MSIETQSPKELSSGGAAGCSKYDLPAGCLNRLSAQG